VDSFERKSGRNARMPYSCSKCDKELEKQQGYEYQGKLFCEDCYMDVLSPPKACDPWAVHSAQTFLKGKDKLATLTPLQLRLVNYLKQKGEATLEELIKNLNLTEEELRREFAVLRHMEILRATKRGDKVFYLLF
jgi:DNA-directed RNA polymerase subunit RPC12/RpoP